MKTPTKTYLGKELVGGMLGLDILDISDEEYSKYHDKARGIIHYVWKNDRELYDAVEGLIDSLKLNGLWRGRDFVFCNILSILYRVA
jgi:hypothetical protein